MGWYLSLRASVSEPGHDVIARRHAHVQVRGGGADTGGRLGAAAGRGGEGGGRGGVGGGGAGGRGGSGDQRVADFAETLRGRGEERRASARVEWGVARRTAFVFSSWVGVGAPRVLHVWKRERESVCGAYLVDAPHGLPCEVFPFVGEGHPQAAHVVHRPPTQRHHPDTPGQRDTAA